MKQITHNDQLIPGEWYWVYFNKECKKPMPVPVTAENGRLDKNGDIVRYMGYSSNKIWCHSSNSQALEMYEKIIGPIPSPERI